MNRTKMTTKIYPILSKNAQRAFKNKVGNYNFIYISLYSYN